jgi:hypothetical protein
MFRGLLLHLIMFNGKNTRSVRLLLRHKCAKHSQETEIYAVGEIGTRNPSKRAAANLLLRPHYRWDRRHDINKKSYFQSTMLL